MGGFFPRSPFLGLYQTGEINALEAQTTRTALLSRVYFQPASDITSLFTTAKGETQVQDVGYSVGLMLDKSLMGGKTAAAFMAGQPEITTNGDFSNGSANWDVSNSDATHIVTFADGTMRYQSDTTTPLLSVRQSGKLTIGKWYRIEIECSTYVSGSLKTDNNGSGAVVLVSKVGKNVAYVRAVSTVIELVRNTANVDLTMDSISVKEIPGNHAYQTTAGARPTYARYPKGGRRNRLVWTEDFSNAAWVKANVTLTNGALTVNGNTFSKLEATASAVTEVKQDATINASSAVGSVYLRKGSGAGDMNIIQLRNQTTGTNLIAARVDLDTGVITYITGSSGVTAEAQADGSWRVAVTAAITSGNLVRFSVGSNGSMETAGEFSYIRGVQLEVGSVATPYQKVTGNYDVTEVPLAHVYGLLFDAVDDSMVTNDVDFTDTDKVTVIAGVRKLSDAATAVLLELSPTVASNNGSFALFAPSAVQPDYGWVSKGTTIQNAPSVSGQPAPDSSVLAGMGNIQGDVARLLANGVQIAQSLGDQGTGNYRKDKLYIGARAGTSLFFNGYLHDTVICPSLLSAADQAMIQRLIAKSAGVDL